MAKAAKPVVFDPKTTGVVVIDLQNAIVSRQLAPYEPGAVVERSIRLADALRKKGAKIFFVHVLIHEILARPVDAPSPSGGQEPAADACDLVPEIKLHKSDHVIAKRQWGAFYGTPLEQLCRRAGIKTIVMAGIATNMGVESTARAAFDLGFELIFAEDAMTSLSAEAHKFSIDQMFPKMGRVRQTDEIIRAAESASISENSDKVDTKAGAHQIDDAD